MLNKNYKGNFSTLMPLLERLKIKDNTSLFNMQLSLNELYDDIRKNLEEILNARTVYIEVPSYLSELASSIINYGLKDFSHYICTHKIMQHKLCNEVRNAISWFEPRLKNTSVYLENPEQPISRVIKLRIEGEITIKKIAKTSVFESAMDLKNYHFEFS